MLAYIPYMDCMGTIKKNTFFLKLSPWSQQFSNSQSRGFSHSQAKTDFLILSEPLVYEPGRYSEAVVDRIGRWSNRFCKGFLCCFYLWFTKSYEKSPS